MICSVFDRLERCLCVLFSPSQSLAVEEKSIFFFGKGPSDQSFISVVFDGVKKGSKLVAIHDCSDADTCEQFCIEQISLACIVKPYAFCSIIQLNQRQSIELFSDFTNLQKKSWSFAGRKDAQILFQSRSYFASKITRLQLKGNLASYFRVPTSRVISLKLKSKEFSVDFLAFLRTSIDCNQTLFVSTYFNQIMMIDPNDREKFTQLVFEPFLSFVESESALKKSIQPPSATIMFAQNLGSKIRGECSPQHFVILMLIKSKKCQNFAEFSQDLSHVDDLNENLRNFFLHFKHCGQTDFFDTIGERKKRVSLAVDIGDIAKLLIDINELSGIDFTSKYLPKVEDEDYSVSLQNKIMEIFLGL